jgi:hypothetical protein
MEVYDIVLGVGLALVRRRKHGQQISQQRKLLACQINEV